jgi:lipopolysaccharide transport system ATP-binding protein
MSSDPAIRVSRLSKFYQIYDKPHHRLKQTLWRGKRQFYREFAALRDVSFTVEWGEVVGIIGRNGAGKSTLLQLICGTLMPSQGSVSVHGRVAALLELGAGFKPEFTGRENVYMNAAILGLSREEIDQRYDEIVAFADIGEFIDQPVKTYSSGMYVRLAFSVAAHIDPDILVIDEALSVGDAAFARKSFDRIMSFKKAGKTILFCSHSLYQVEAFCDRAIWLDRGQAQMDGDPSEVVAAYNDFLEQGVSAREQGNSSPRHDEDLPPAIRLTRITGVKASVDGVEGFRLSIKSGENDLCVRVMFASDPDLPPPCVAVAISGAGRRYVSSASSKSDGLVLKRDRDGKGVVEICFPKIPLLKGNYGLDVYLLYENGIKLYDKAIGVAELKVVQEGLEQGIVRLNHEWRLA